MTYDFILQGETPAKKNSRINLKNGRSIPSKRYRDWHEVALAQLRLQLPEDMQTIESPCQIVLFFTHGDLRRRDSDNGCSSIMDLLVDAGVLKDDNWQIVRQINVTNSYEKNKPSVLITILTI